MKLSLSALCFSVATVAFSGSLGGCASSTSEEELDEPSEDELVATFDRRGNLDLQKPSRLVLVGDSSKLGALPLYAAVNRARRYAELYPGDQVVLFVTKDVTDRTVERTGATVVRNESFPNVTMSDLSRLSASKLISAMDRFVHIASIDFFGHSSPFGALLEKEGSDRVLAADQPSNVRIIGNNFLRDRNPYVTLNGCNGAVETAAELSRLWKVPVSGAFTGTNFQILMNDGRWYINDEGRYPETVQPATKNEISFKNIKPSCAGSTCIRMKPENAPYWGVWSREDTGFQYGANHYKFMCDYDDQSSSCLKGMAQSLYAFPSVKPIDATSSDDDLKEVLADYFCTGAKDAAWFDTCRANLFSAVESGAAFSPMKGGNDYTLECDFKKCEQKFRCDVVEGVPQKKSCVWVSGTCRDDQSAAQCKKKNTVKQMARTEFKAFVEGHRMLRGQ